MSPGKQGKGNSLWKNLIESQTTWRAACPYVGLLCVIVVLGLLWHDYQDTRMPFTVVFNGQPYTGWTHQKTVSGALLDAGLHISSHDIVEPELNSPLHLHDVIAVQKAATVLIEADTHSIEHYTHKKTSQDILAEAGVEFTEYDDILAGGEKISPDSIISWPPHNPPVKRTMFGDKMPPWKQTSSPPIRLVLKRATTLYVNDGGIPTTIHTTATTIGEALRDHDIIVYLGDRVTPSLGSRVSTGLKVYIQRSKAIELIADDHSLHTRTRGETVADVLGQQRVALIGHDFVEPAERTPVQDGMGIRVSRVSRATLVEQETIPFETIWQPAADIEIDNQHVDQEGEEGISKRRLHVVYRDGEEVNRKQEDEWLENEPKIKIIAYGTKIVPQKLQTESGTLTYWRKVRMLATSYSAATSGKAPDHPQYGITFTGVPVKHGIVAVDPKVVGLNSSVYVPGYGTAKVGDTGGGIKGRRIDLGYSDDDLTMWYKWVDVFLLGNPPPPDQIRWVLPNWPIEKKR